MRGPLAVTVVDGTTHRHVTGAVTGLKFTKTAPGGYAFASMRLRLPRGTFTDLGPADKVVVTDARTGRTVWEGFTENPGVIDGPGGQEYDLSAIGTTTLASDQSRALVYVDRDLGRWEEAKYSSTAPSASAGASDDPADTSGGASQNPGILCQINPGQPIGTGKVATARYLAMEEAGMDIGAIALNYVSGKNDAGYVPDLTTRLPSGSGGTSDFGTSISTTPSTRQFRFQPSWWPAGHTRAELRLRRTGGATNVADDDTWTFFYDITIIARLKTRYGVDLDRNNYDTGSVLDGHVVDDLIWRAMPYVDKRSVVLAFAASIDQLAYPDGATPRQILDDLQVFGPDALWELLEHTGNGYRFNYRLWPTTSRYEVSTARDGFDAPGGEVDLCNRIAVYWTDAKGARQTTIVTSVVPALDAVGRVRDAEPIELESGRGSTANAQLIGERTLAAKNKPPRAGTATVARWVLDRDTGRMVGPWEIEAGHLVRVRETGEDLRLTEVEYSDESCSATLTLGTPVLTEEQRIAQLSSSKRRV